MRKKRKSWMLLTVLKPSKLLFFGKQIGKKVQIKEYPCFAEDSMVRVYLFDLKPENRFFKKTMWFFLRLCGSAALTYLFALWLIEQAFLERGYCAYGGEILFIPLVFLIIFKLLGRKLEKNEQKKKWNCSGRLCCRS